MTNLSTELARLHADLRNSVGNISGYIDAITALNQKLQANLPTIIAALKAAETPLGDMAGLVERLLKRNYRDGYPDVYRNPDGPEAAAAITALTRQLAERDAENKRLREALWQIAELTARRQLPLTAQINDTACQALGGDNG